MICNDDDALKPLRSSSITYMIYESDAKLKIAVPAISIPMNIDHISTTFRSDEASAR